MFAEDGGGSGRLKGGVALAPDPVLKKLGGLLRPMFLIGLDPILQGWWLSRLVNASWRGVIFSANMWTNYECSSSSSSAKVCA
jgi:hypothetical protein